MSSPVQCHAQQLLLINTYIAVVYLEFCPGREEGGGRGEGGKLTCHTDCTCISRGGEGLVRGVSSLVTFSPIPLTSTYMGFHYGVTETHSAAFSWFTYKHLAMLYVQCRGEFGGGGEGGGEFALYATCCTCTAISLALYGIHDVAMDTVFSTNKIGYLGWVWSMTSLCLQ